MKYFRKAVISCASSRSPFLCIRTMLSYYYESYQRYRWALHFSAFLFDTEDIRDSLSSILVSTKRVHFIYLFIVHGPIMVLLPPPSPWGDFSLWFSDSLYILKYFGICYPSGHGCFWLRSEVKGPFFPL